MEKNVATMVFYLFAPDWDKNSFSKKNLFVNECRNNGLSYETIDVDTENGTALSIKYGVRNVPTAVFVCGKKVVGIEKGNKIHEDVYKYCK